MRIPSELPRSAEEMPLNSLLQHDWLHRWKKIFQLSGIEASPGMMAREEHLKRLAHAALYELEARTAP